MTSNVKVKVKSNVTTELLFESYTNLLLFFSFYDKFCEMFIQKQVNQLTHSKYRSIAHKHPNSLGNCKLLGNLAEVYMNPFDANEILYTIAPQRSFH